ncbi:MAG: LamG domain-containing protein [Planctomycetes bacterium]|nr:LamG domain-containing protein [Planctomycetota bacterium]
MDPDQSQKQIDAEYQAALGVAENLARKRGYAEASNRLSVLKGDPRFVTLLPRIEQDVLDFQRQGRVIEAALEALKQDVGKPFEVKGTEFRGILTRVLERRLLIDVEGKLFSIESLSLPAEQLVDLARPAMVSLGAEGHLGLGLFWLMEGEVGNAQEAMEQAALNGCDVSSYQSRIPAFLQVESHPPAAHVRVHLRMECPCRLPARNHQTYRLRFSKPGYQPQTLKVDTGEGGLYPIRAELEPLRIHPEALEGLLLWLRSDRGVQKDPLGRVFRWDDLSGRGNHALQSNLARQPRWSRDPRTGKAVFNFDGEDDHLDAPGSASPSPTKEITIMGWIRPEPPGQSATSYLLSQYRLDTKWGSWFLSFSRKQTLGFSVFDFGGREVRIHSKTVMPWYHWTHFAAVFQRGTIALFIGGELDERLETELTEMGPRDWSWSVTIGGAVTPLETMVFKGGIADVRIYNRALPQEEIRKLAQEEP